MSASAHILIAGAGIAGLTAGLILARQGHSVDILEQAETPGAIGAGVTLAPNAMRIFAKLGLEAAITQTGVEPSRQSVQHGLTDTTLLSFERGDTMRAHYGAPYIYIHRADLHHVLLDAVLATGRAKIHAGARVIGAQIGEAAITLNDAQGRSFNGDLAVGADGVKSVLRALVAADQPHFTGHIAWRALVPAQGPLAALAADPGIHIGPGRLVVRYPVRGGDLVNLVFFARQDGWLEEGWSIPAEAAELRLVFDGWCEAVQAMIKAITPGTLSKWAIHARQPLARWHHADRLVLIGDAAHAMTPFLGQGAAAAIEDAWVLGSALAATKTWGEGLVRFEDLRRGPCALMQRESNLNADRLQGSEAELYGLGKLVNEETLGLFAQDVTQVLITEGT